jgi:hypothetical protein
MEEDKSSESEELLDFVSNLTGAARLRIEESLPHGYVRLKVAEAERRQAQHDIRSVEDIVIELLRNSRDAGASNILLGFQRDHGRRLITVLDDGRGIPTDMHSMVFEPRVTSKSEDFEEDRYGVHGRGMALFSIRSRVDDATILDSDEGRGAAIGMTVDLADVPERADQATFPVVEDSDGERYVGNGPHNVPRVMLEMAMDHPGMNFFLGSFSEVLATLRRVDRAGSPWRGISELTDARELAALSARLGIPVSERNCYRVLADEILPLERVAVDHAGTARRAGTVKKTGGNRAGLTSRSPLKAVGQGELELLARDAGRLADGMLEPYYMRAIEARARRSRGRITITILVKGRDEDGPER